MYAKVFCSILDSSIWLEPDATRIVWFTLLLSMDRDGYAHFSSTLNLAKRANVDVTLCNAAVVTLESPDVNSGDTDHDGRRIEKVPGGWMILNSQKYRALQTDIKRRESTRLRVEKHRAKKAGKSSSNAGNALQRYVGVTAASDSASDSSSGKGSGENQTVPTGFPLIEHVIARASMCGGTEDQAKAFWNHFESVGWIDKNGHRVTRWEPKFANWIASERGGGFRNGQPTPPKADHSKGF